MNQTGAQRSKNHTKKEKGNHKKRVGRKTFRKNHAPIGDKAEQSSSQNDPKH
jgi:hypothetical protein